MFKQLIENVMGQHGISLSHQKESTFNNNNHSNDDGWTLKIGDQISLWAETNDDGIPVNVFLSASGVSSQHIQVSGIVAGKHDTPSNFKGKQNFTRNNNYRTCF